MTRYIRLMFDGDGTPIGAVHPMAWTPMRQAVGLALEGIDEVGVEPWSRGRTHFVRIPAGGSMPMHANDDHVFCVVVAGEGRLGLPSGDGVRYRAPEVMIFDPGVPHSWDDITEDTMLAVCLVDAGP